jgi:hypothetical protein
MSREHLFKDDRKRGEGGGYRTDAPNEWRCQDCRNRITIGPDGTEFGHATRSQGGRFEGRCRHRDESLDAGTPSVDSRLGGVADD